MNNCTERRCIRPMSNRNRLLGFTLVELLVVIGIIAVLISILLPTMNRARQAARSAMCLSNMRQIAMGFFNYSTIDRLGRFPEVRRVPDWTEYWDRQLITLKMVNPKVLVCPGDFGPTRSIADYLGNNPGLPRSYAYNAYVGYDPLDPIAPGAGAGGRARKMKGSASTIILVSEWVAADVATRGTQVIGWSTLAASSRDREATRGLHGKNSTNMIFADSHAESIYGNTGNYSDPEWTVFWNPGRYK